MSRRGRRRVLSTEERALWSHVVRSVTPLKPAAPEEPPPVQEAAPPAPPEATAAPAAPPAKRAARSTPAAPPLAALEPKTRRRLGRGAEVDARLDLHGLTQAAAHHRLRLFLAEAQASGHSVVLVITGKGDPDRLTGPAFGEGRGVLKRAVPLWLAEPELRAVVVGFEPAGRRHGGDGALYVRIRRRRA